MAHPDSRRSAPEAGSCRRFEYRPRTEPSVRRPSSRSSALGLRWGRRMSGVVIALWVAGGTPLPAQDVPKGPKPSQHGSVSQRVNDTTITVEYNRPVARGRELFGKLVPYGRIWCPCADDATTVEVSTPGGGKSYEVVAVRFG